MTLTPDGRPDPWVETTGVAYPQPEPVPEWNPLASTAVQVIPLKVSGGRAHVHYRPWSGRERLAYEDAVAVRFLAKDAEGEESVLMGTLRLYAISLTVVGSEGFPPGPVNDSPTPRLFLSGTREQREADLLALDAATYTEIRETAFRVQPLPTLAGDDGPGDGDDDADPSRTPSTPQAAAPPAA